MKTTVIDHFRSRDGLISGLAEKFPDLDLSVSDEFFRDLAESIICQQLSEKAGGTIWKRVKALTGEKFTPEAVLALPVEMIRSAGTSRAKAEYVRNTARSFRDGKIRPDLFDDLSDEAVIAALTTIKGIGRWTAEMFLIFSLGREDVFSFGDAGLMRAMKKLYGRKNRLSKNRIIRITRKWSPYRSYACLLLWKSLENHGSGA